MPNSFYKGRDSKYFKFGGPYCLRHKYSINSAGWQESGHGRHVNEPVGEFASLLRILRLSQASESPEGFFKHRMLTPPLEFLTTTPWGNHFGNHRSPSHTHTPTTLSSYCEYKYSVLLRLVVGVWVPGILNHLPILVPDNNHWSSLTEFTEAPALLLGDISLWSSVHLGLAPPWRRGKGTLPAACLETDQGRKHSLLGLDLEPGLFPKEIKWGWVGGLFCLIVLFVLLLNGLFYFVMCECVGLNPDSYLLWKTITSELQRLRRPLKWPAVRAFPQIRQNQVWSW